MYTIVITKNTINTTNLSNFLEAKKEGLLENVSKNSLQKLNIRGECRNQIKILVLLQQVE